MKKFIYAVMIAALLSGCAGTMPAPPASATRETPAPPPVSAAQADTNAVDADVLSYLKEVALSGFEFGEAPRVAYKWTHDVTVSVSGDLTEADHAAIDTVIADLNGLIAPRQVTLVPAGGDITIWYGPDAQFAQRVPGYTPGNRGYFSIRYNTDYSLRSATILISTAVDLTARSHLVREELTQSFGFFQDSHRDPLSIFQQDWTLVQTYSALDRAIIPLLYDDRVLPGMTPAEVLALFS